jgi:exonuclease SbcD
VTRRRKSTSDAAPDLPAEVRQVPLFSGIRLRTLRGTLERLAGLAAAGYGDSYLRLVLEELPRPGLAEEARALFPNVVDVEISELARPAAQVLETSMRVGAPSQLFAEFLAEQGKEDPELLRLFDDLLDEVLAGERGDH